VLADLARRVAAAENTEGNDMGTRRLDVGIENVTEVYAGPGGILWRC